MYDLCIIGAGRVGLVTACCFAERGRSVIAVDKDEGKIANLLKGCCPFFEPGLEELLFKNRRNGRLHFSTQVPEAIQQSLIIFICVDTPALPDGRPNMSQVEEVSREIGRHLTEYRLIVEKSTVPAKTSERIRHTIALVRPVDVDFDVASNPEFLREGTAVRDFMSPDRIIIGAESNRARAMLLDLYQDFDCPIITTDVTTSEIIKHASNSFLALKISFINLIADLCEKAGADITKVAEGMGYDHRIGHAFLQAGAGYGGSCFSKDVQAFASIADDLRVDSTLLRLTDQINEDRVTRLMEKLIHALWTLDNKRVTILGLAFKPDTDDIRSAPSIKLIDRLVKAGVAVQVYDPQAMESVKKVYGAAHQKCRFFPSAYEAVDDADAIVLMTEWEEFRALDLVRVRERMRCPVVIDGRNIFDPGVMKALGFQYCSVGRPQVIGSLREAVQA